MSSGSISKNYTTSKGDVWSRSYKRSAKPSAWELQAAAYPLTRTASKTWSGLGRAVPAREKQTVQSRRRFYTALVTYTYKRTKGKHAGTWKTVTRLVKRSFVTRPVPKRYREYVKTVPHSYTYTKTAFVDGLIDGVDIYPSNSANPTVWEIKNDTILRRSAWPTYAAIAPFDANDQIKLINKLKDKIRGSSFDLSKFIGEGRDTVSMITQSSLRLAEAFWNVRKGNLVGAAKILATGKGHPPVKVKKTIGENWLQLQYGWLPLLSDVKDGAEQLAHILNYPKTEKYSARITRKGVPTGSHRWSTADKSISRNISVYVTEPESLTRLSGILDPENVAWELVPFSFIADWFIPIGDYLGARAFASSLQTSMVVTTNVSSERLSGYYEQFWNVYDILKISGNGGTYNTVSYDRVVSSSLSVPMPVVKPLAQSASFMHMANAVALVSVIFSPKRLPSALNNKFTVPPLIREQRPNRSEYIPQWNNL